MRCSSSPTGAIKPAGPRDEMIVASFLVGDYAPIQYGFLQTSQLYLRCAAIVSVTIVAKLTIFKLFDFCQSNRAYRRWYTMMDGVPLAIYGAFIEISMDARFFFTKFPHVLFVPCAYRDEALPTPDGALT